MLRVRCANSQCLRILQDPGALLLGTPISLRDSNRMPTEMVTKQHLCTGCERKLNEILRWGLDTAHEKITIEQKTGPASE